MKITIKNFTGDEVDIIATAIGLGDTCYDLLPMYALTGCDSVSFSVLHGQARGLKVVQNYKLEPDSVLGNVETSYESALIKKVLNFFVTCMVASRLCQ